MIEVQYHYSGQPRCPRCVRPHAHEPTVIVDGVVGCMKCHPVDLPPPPQHEIDLSKHARFAPKHPSPVMSPRAIVLHTMIKLVGSCTVEQFKLIEAIPPPPEPLGEWDGEVGDRLERKLKCEFVRELLPPGDYGRRFLVKFSGDGRQYVWRTGESCWCEDGIEYTLRGTVKELGEYEGVKQTVLTRCKEVKPK